MASPPRKSMTLPQVRGIARFAAGSSRLTTKRTVLDYVARNRGDSLSVHLRPDGEVWLIRGTAGGDGTLAASRGRVKLPDWVAERLGLQGNGLVACLERDGGVALKRVVTEETRGSFPELHDVETCTVLRRVLTTNPPVDEACAGLSANLTGARLEHSVAEYLRHRTTLSAWQSRRLLGCAESGDDELAHRLVTRRRELQRADGSWSGDVLETARALRELAVLGLPAADETVSRGVSWLLALPESAHNPGMFFAVPELVAEQAAVVAAREAGRGGRFRAVKVSEQRRVAAADPLLRAPCGPRIMWPTALVLEALIALGLYEQPRVHRALAFMTRADWCECAYQHGDTAWHDPAAGEDGGIDLDAFEDACRTSYRLGGFSSLATVARADGYTSGARLRRVDRLAAGHGGAQEFAVELPDHIQGCEFITTRALSGLAKDLPARRFAAAHVWRFAGLQRGPDGRFPEERYGTGFGMEGILQAISRYDLPVAKLVILRAIPWIIANQNEDGSWGNANAVGGTRRTVARPRVGFDGMEPAEEGRDAATLAVVEALARVRAELPRLVGG